ncbi:hypothetical protein [Nocardioides daejeonensis]|uniref:hypothetical protein n=1 Tax=Nocardioides daejeonensis TaxID=1046556 RepID=UPI000D74AE62|nr:hypothetical protein [Nocardioides daejeonensis]
MHREPASPWPFVGMIGLFCALFLYGASVLLAPWWGVLLLLTLWLVLFGMACKWWTPHPKRLPFLAIFAMLFWFCFINAGGAWLGWVA